MSIVVLLSTCLLGAKADVDPNFYIYICFGQSNMEGNAQPESIDRTGIDKRFQLLATCNFTNPSRTKGKWYTATPPLVSPNGGLGPSDYFGRMMVECLPENVRVGVIPVAMGGSPIEMFDKDKYKTKIQEKESNGGTPWWATLANMHYGGNPYGRIIEMAKEAQKVGVIKGILLHQGCSNNGDSNWPNMVRKIYNDMLTDLGLGTDSVPLFVGETLYQNQGGSCYAHNTQVARVPSVIKNSYVVSSDGCPGNGKDTWHFNAWGYRVLGSRYAAEALYALGVQPSFFPFHNYTFVSSKNASFDEKTRTVTYQGAGLTSWTYPHFADWSGYKYLVVKLKEPQTVDAEVWLYGATKNVSYRDSIRERTTVVIDLHNLRYNNKVMDPSQVYKMAFRSPKAGKIVIDDVFLSNDIQYDPTGICATLTNSEQKIENSIYDLQGRQIVNGKSVNGKLQKGLYIQNGKKMIIK